MNSPAEGHEILMEVAQVGNILRVAAMDPKTLHEVTFQAPMSADQATLAALARRKLAFVSRRKSKT
ncbi:MAG: hypothetical protein AAGA21_12675 [Pseudomonadota bacterium]